MAVDAYAHIPRESVLSKMKIRPPVRFRVPPREWLKEYPTARNSARWLDYFFDKTKQGSSLLVPYVVTPVFWRERGMTPIGAGWVFGAPRTSSTVVCVLCAVYCVIVGMHCAG